MTRALFLSLILTLGPAAVAQSGESPPPPEEALQKSLEDTLVSFKFLETPMRACVQFLSEQSGVNIAIGSDIWGDAPITFNADDMPLRRALHWIAVLGGADTVLRGSTVLLASPENVAREFAELRLFDVRDLTLGTPDHPGRDIYPGGMSDDEYEAVFEGSDYVSLDADTLVDLIVTTVEPRSWDIDGMSINSRRGVLFVSNTPLVHEKIAALLADLRLKSIRLVSVDALAYTVSAADWLETLADAESGDAPHLLSAEATQALRDAPGNLRLRNHLQTSCASGQRVNVHVGAQRTRLLDLDVEVAQGSAAADPIMGLVSTGFVVDVRPTPSADGKQIVLRVQLQSVDIRNVNKVPYGAADPSTSATRPELELLHTATFETRTTVRVANGASCVFAFDDPSPTAESGSRMVIILQASLTADGQEEE